MKFFFQMVLFAVLVFLFMVVVQPVFHYAFFSFWFTLAWLFVAAGISFSSSLVEEGKAGGSKLLTTGSIGATALIAFFAFFALSGIDTCNKQKYAEIGSRPLVSIIGDSLPEKKIEQMSTISTGDQASAVMQSKVNDWIKDPFELTNVSPVTFKGRGYYIALVVPKDIVPLVDAMSNKEAFGYAMIDKITNKVTFTKNDAKGNPLHIKYLDRNWFGKNITNAIYWSQGKDTGLSDYTLEIDDEFARPYITPSRYEHTIGFWGTKNAGVLTFDLQTGESKSYEIGKAPGWVDAVLDPRIEFDNINYRGLYGKRFGIDSFNYMCPRFDIIPGRNEENLFYYPIKRGNAMVGYILQSSTTGIKKFYQFKAGLTAHDEDEMVSFLNASNKIEGGSVDDLDPVVIGGMPVYYGVVRDKSGAPIGYVFTPIFQLGNKTDKFFGFEKQMLFAYNNLLKEYQKYALDAGLSGSNMISSQYTQKLGVISEIQYYSEGALLWIDGVSDTSYVLLPQDMKGMPRKNDTLMYSILQGDTRFRRITIRDYTIGFTPNKK